MPPKKINIINAVDQQITTLFDPYVVGDVNDSQVKVAKFGKEFEWHTHTNEDEAFLVLRGRIALDFRNGTVELEQGEFLNVVRGTEHRPRSLSDAPVVLMFEPTSTLNTGDVENDLTVSELKQLHPNS